MIRAWLSLAINCAFFAYSLRHASLTTVLAIALLIGAASGASLLLIDIYLARRQRRRDRDRDRHD